MVWPSIVRAGNAVIGLVLAIKGIVAPPMTTWEADVARERRVPDTVMAGPPGDKVCPPMTIGAFGFAVNVEPPKIKAGELGAGVIPGALFKETVLPPITIDAAEGPRLSFVPLTSMALPGDKVCPAITNWEDGFAVMIDAPNVIDGGPAGLGAVTAAGTGMIWPPMLTWEGLTTTG